MYLISAIAGFSVGWLAAGRGEKTTDLRLFDVAVLGPWLVLLSHRIGMTNTERLVLSFAGGATIGYNGHNMMVATNRQKA